MSVPAFLRNCALVVLLCDAVARGLIWHLCGADNIEPAPLGDKGKNRAEKGMEKAASVHGVFLDPTALQDVYKALEVHVSVSACGSSMGTMGISNCFSYLIFMFNIYQHHRSIYEE